MSEKFKVSKWFTRIQLNASDIKINPSFVIELKLRSKFTSDLDFKRALDKNLIETSSISHFDNDIDFSLETD